MEKATRMAPKVMNMADCLLAEHLFERIDDSEKLKKEDHTQEDVKQMKAIRKASSKRYTDIR